MTPLASKREVVMSSSKPLPWLLVGLGLLCLAAGSTSPVKGKLRIDPTILPVVPSACADGNRDWRVPLETTARELRTVLESFPWRARRAPAPDFDCRFSLELACAPDLDGDGTREFVGRLRWQQRLGATRDKPCTALAENEPNLVRHEAILVLRKSGAPAAWQAVDLVSFAADGIDGMARARVDFVQLPDGKNGLRCKVQTENPGQGCQVTAFWVGALVGDRLEKVGEADPRFCKPD